MTIALLKHAVTTALVASSALVGIAQANPVVVDFETGFDLVGPGQAAAYYEEAGLRFTPTGGDALVDYSYCGIFEQESCATGNETVYLTAFNDAEVTVTASRWFTLNRLDASFVPLPGYGLTGLFGGLPMGLKLKGILWNGGVLETDLAMEESTTVPGDFVFGTYKLTPDWTLLRSVTLGACLFTQVSVCVRSEPSLFANDLQFAIDNLAVSIPEPSALALAMLALAGVATARRRANR